MEFIYKYLSNDHIIPLLISFFSTIIFIKLCYKLAISVDLVDRPNWRKNHTGKIPVIGGLAIVFGFLLGCLISPRALSEWRPFFFCIIPLIVIGVLDDHGDISVFKRIIAQVFTCAIMVYYGQIYLTNFGDILGLGFPITFFGFEPIVTVICVVGIINAFNLIDGIDGLCGILSINAFISIITILTLKSANASISLILYFFSATLSYLIFNLGLNKKFFPKIFLGDTGTTIIGFFISWYLIKLSSEHSYVFRPIFAVWIIAIPIMDTVAVMFRRLLKRQSPFVAGKDHIHHILMDMGLKSRQVLIILLIFSVILSSIAVYLEYNQIYESVMFISFIFIFTIYYFTLSYLSRLSK